MRIHVTQEHISAGVRENCRMCPVALAIKEAMRRQDISASHHIIIVHHFFTSPTPRSARLFISRFDSGEQVKPFSFNLPGAEKWRRA